VLTLSVIGFSLRSNQRPKRALLQSAHVSPDKERARAVLAKFVNVQTPTT
jgi:hypothetical protein